jgi:hypothetical protein
VSQPEWDPFVLENPALFFAIFTKWMCYRGYSITYEYGGGCCYQAGDSVQQLESPEEENPLMEMSINFSDLFEKPSFADVTFKFGNRELKGHKGILSCKLLVIRKYSKFPLIHPSIYKF